MQRTINLLAILLAAQLVLALGLAFTGPSLRARPPHTPLVELDDRAVDRVLIEGPEGRQIEIVRQGDGWILPSADGYPADRAKVDLLLERLRGLTLGLAVATSPGAQKRFKVSEDAFERRLTLSQGKDTLATLYFGTSPGMREVHARRAEDKAVYTTDFGVYDAPLSAEEWEDKDVLKIPKDEIESLRLGALTLTRSAPAAAGDAEGQDATAPTVWSAEPLQPGEAVDSSAADTLARTLAGLHIGSVLGHEAKAEYGLETPVLVLTVQRKGGERIEYRLGKREGGKDFVLKVSTRPEYFRLPSFTGEALAKAAGRERLVHAPQSPPSTAEGKTQSPPEHSPSAPTAGSGSG